MSGRWASSNRRTSLPPDWRERRADVKRRAGGQCQATIHVPECDGIGAECDHIRDPDDHSSANLQWLSTPCHAAKTQAEAQAARLPRARPQPPHPGVI